LKVGASVKKSKSAAVQQRRCGCEIQTKRFKKIAKTVPSKNATYHAVENCVALHLKKKLK